MPEIRSAAMIVNAQSRKGRHLFKHACAAMKDLPFPVDARAVRDPAKLDETMRTLLADKPDLLILGGGDGTISGLVEHLIGTDTILGLLPFGTANSFVRSMTIPLDIAGAIAVIANGAPRRVDLGMVDGHYFANCAAIGISPKIAETVPHRLKRYLGRIGYLSWATLQFAKFRPFCVIVDDGTGEHRVEAVEVRISNGPFHGGTELVDDASVDNGVIVVEAVQGHFKRRLLKNWGASILRLPARNENVIDFRGKSLTVATEPPLPISIDGEVLAKTPVTARIAAGVIRVMAPRTDAQKAQ